MLFIPEDYEKKFQDIADAMNEAFSAKYVIYILERKDHTNRITHSTNAAWQKIYPIKFADHCHLFEMVRTALEKRNLPTACFPWAYIQPKQKDHKYTEACRREYGIHNGISGGSRFGNFIEAFSIGGDRDDEDYFKKLLAIQPWIQVFKLRIRELALSEMIARQWEDPAVLQYSMIDYFNTPTIGEYQPKR